MNSKKSSELRILLEVSLSAALALALSFFKIFRLPQGGDVSFMAVPILILALVRGAKYGIACGMIFGVIHSLQGGFVIHPVQFLLDYPFAFGALGLAGIFSRLVFKEKIKIFFLIEFNILVGTAGRFFFHFLSGMIFFKSFAPAAMSAVKYVLIYNLSYIVPELLICFVIIPPVIYKLRGAYEN